MKAGEIVTNGKTVKTKYRARRRGSAGEAAMLSVYSLVHLFVDLCCCAAVLRFTGGTEYFAMSLLIYNFCAFAMQMPIGAIADGMQKPGPLSVAGCVVIAVSMIATPAPYVLAAMLGIGNACFHVGGGVHVMRADSGCSRLGVFVAPGAVGLVIGRAVSSSTAVTDTVLMIAVAVIMAASAALIILTEPLAVTYESVTPFPHGITVSYPGRRFLACVCFFMASALCSFGGLSFAFEWQSKVDVMLATVLITAAATLGKVLGGIVSDSIGMKAAAAMTLAVSAVLMLWSGNMYASLCALLFFNMTVPVTLRAAADNVRGHEGFAYGLCKLALFVGFVPTMLGASVPFGTYGNVAVAVLTLAMMAAGLESASHAGRR